MAVRTQTQKAKEAEAKAKEALEEARKEAEQAEQAEKARAEQAKAKTYSYLDKEGNAVNGTWADLIKEGQEASKRGFNADMCIATILWAVYQNDDYKAAQGEYTNIGDFAHGYFNVSSGKGLYLCKMGKYKEARDLARQVNMTAGKALAEALWKEEASPEDTEAIASIKAKVEAYNSKEARAKRREEAKAEAKAKMDKAIRKAVKKAKFDIPTLLKKARQALKGITAEQAKEVLPLILAFVAEVEAKASHKEG
jgi:hypothetical protein